MRSFNPVRSSNPVRDRPIPCDPHPIPCKVPPDWQCFLPPIIRLCRTAHRPALLASGGVYTKWMRNAGHLYVSRIGKASGCCGPQKRGTIPWKISVTDRRFVYTPGAKSVKQTSCGFDSLAVGFNRRGAGGTYISALRGILLAVGFNKRGADATTTRSSPSVRSGCAPSFLTFAVGGSGRAVCKM